LEPGGGRVVAIRRRGGQRQQPAPGAPRPTWRAFSSAVARAGSAPDASARRQLAADRRHQPEMRAAAAARDVRRQLRRLSGDADCGSSLRRTEFADGHDTVCKAFGEAKIFRLW